jgi:myo-inositol 2-dehydrogenase/D-chiro-inositol 1-dehydrogenase
VALSSTSIGFGIIGLGRIGAFHAETLSSHTPGAHLVAAAVDPAHFAVLESEGGAPCEVLDNVEALVARDDVEAIVVASPATLHKEHISLAAAAGKPIFSEKPLAVDVADGEAATTIVKATGIPFQIGFQRRFDRSYARAHQLIADGAIGDVEMFRGMSCDRLGPIEFLRTSGGLFLDLASHDFDAARFLTGQEVVEVHAVGSVQVEPELASFDDVDYGIVLMRFASGALGVVQASWRAPYGYDIRAEVHGSLGKVVAEVDEKFPAVLYDRRGKVSARHDQFLERFGDAYRLEIQEFVKALHGGIAPSPGIDDAMAALRIADAATRSRRQGEWVRVSGDDAT